MKNIGYKVFEKIDGKLYSAGNIPHYLKMQYSETKENFSKIKGGKLFFFKDFFYAKSFHDSINCFDRKKELVILKIEYTDEESFNLLPNVWYNSYTTHELEKFWLYRNWWNSSDKLGGCFSGVFGTSSIKLICEAHE